MKRILIVDDSTCTRKCISMMLKLNDYITYEAGDGLDALEKMGNLKLDLVIVEQDMPNMDGLTFAKSVRNNFYLLDVPIIMVTARYSEGLKQEALGAGIDRIYPKPVSSALLASGIASLLRERADGSPADG